MQNEAVVCSYMTNPISHSYVHEFPRQTCFLGLNGTFYFCMIHDVWDQDDVNIVIPVFVVLTILLSKKRNKDKVNGINCFYWISQRSFPHSVTISQQCCQCRGLPAELGYFKIAYRVSKTCWAGGLKLGYFKIACHGSKTCWAGGLKLGYFSSVYPWRLFFLQIL